MQDRQIKFYGGQNMYDYMNAMLADDKEEMKRVSDKIEAEELKRKEIGYKKLDTMLDSTAFLTFSAIDGAIKRHAWTRDVSFYGDGYKYVWFDEKVQVEYEDYGKFDLMITFEKSLFSLGCYYSDESGYDQGIHIIEEGIEPKDLHDKISALKN